MLGTESMRRWMAGFALVAVAAGGTAFLALQRPAKAAVQNYNVTFKGLTKALDGTKIPFIATGTGTVDVVTGAFSYDVSVPELQAEISGTGTIATGPKTAFGLSSFNNEDWSGTAIILGKFSKGTARFKGKIVVAIPDHFGDMLTGFSYTTGSILLEQQIPE